MRVLLDPGLLAAPTRDLDLLTLLGAAEQMQHTVVAERSAVAGWSPSLGALGPAVVQLLDHHRLRAASLSVSTPTVTVDDRQPSDWPAARLSLDDAIRLLRTPLELLLENERSDWSFLRRLADHGQRAQLDEALARGALQVRQGGGIAEVKKSVDALFATGGSPAMVRARRVRRLRTWVMFDRDAEARDPGKPTDVRRPSSASNQLLGACRRREATDPWGMGWHRLPRRSIESYLPASALRQHVRAGSQSAAFVAALDGLRQRAPDVAASIDLKSGLIKDLKKPVKDRVPASGSYDVNVRLAEEAKVLPGDWRVPFDQLAPALRADLLNGLGADVSRLFEEAPPALDPDFPAEYDRQAAGPQDTAAALIESILERV